MFDANQKAEGAARSPSVYQMSGDSNRRQIFEDKVAIAQQMQDIVAAAADVDLDNPDEAGANRIAALCASLARDAESAEEAPPFAGQPATSRNAFRAGLFDGSNAAAFLRDVMASSNSFILPRAAPLR